ncbi:MAG: hypothetical protein JST80_04470 [Bdellovibrionales bacterium]|nr:hypothetical protein [Bdellovibrionales bacterium]
MATRLRVRRKKMVKDRQQAHKKKPSKRKHKIDQARSRKMKRKMINRAR